MPFLDLEGLQILWSNILSKLSDKVDHVEGKQLSTNDFTNEEKTKLASLAQSDWAASENEPGHVLNRTHYDAVMTKTLYNGTFTATAGTLTRINSIPDEMIVNYPDVSVVRATFDGKACTITATTNKWELRDPNGQLVFTMNYDTAKGAQCLVSTYAGSGAHTLVIEADEITAVPLDEKYIPNTIPRRTDIPKMAMPDWNASEGEAGYVKNRTHYEEKNVIIPNTIVDVPSSDLFAALPILDTAIVAGNSYVVELDNEKYTCVAWADGDVIYLGNGNVYPGVNKGENVPFSIDTYPDKTAFLNTQVGNEYVVSIATPGNVKQLDEKFIPDSVKMPKVEGANKQLITDGEGNAKWEERTHWVEYGTTYNYYSTNNVKVSFDQGIYISDSHVENIEEGSKVEVNWNGDIFVCEAKIFQENGLTAIVFGNLSGELEQPFAGIVVPPEVTGEEGYLLQMVDLNVDDGTTTENSFDINVTPVTYHTIDPKFLDGVMKKKSIIINMDENGTITTDFNFEEAWAMDSAELQSNIAIKFNIANQYYYFDLAVFGVEKLTLNSHRGIYLHYLPYNDYQYFTHDIYIWREDGSFFRENQGQLLPSANNDNSFLIYSTSGDRWSECSLEQTKVLLQSGVSSVNGQVGDITLTAEDVGAATASYVDTKVAELVDSSPETLNTLNELAAALGDDPNFATTIATQIGELEESKVEKIAGKGLSTNDYTTADKTLLNTIAEQYLTRNDIADLDTKIEAAHSHATTYKGSAFANGLYKITTNAEGHVTGATAVAKADITALGIPAQDTDTGATSVEVTGAGNAITAASYDAASRKLTLTKGATYTNNEGTVTGINAGTGLSGGGLGGVLTISHSEGSAVNKVSGLYKIATDATSHVKSLNAVVKEDIVALGIPAQDTVPDYFTIEDIDEITGGCPQPSKAVACYTVRIDTTNSNPLTACEYMDDAAGMEKGSSDWDSMPIFDEIKPCTFVNGTVNYYLDPNNFILKADGSAAKLDGTDGDVMIEFQKFAYRLYKEGNYQYVSVTNDPDLVASDNRFQYYAFSRDTVGDVDKMYIGAFKGWGDMNDMLIRSVANGEYPTTSVSLNQLRQVLPLKGANYGIMNYGQLVALQCLYLIKYGNLDCQAALGMGFVENHDEDMPCPMGGTIDKGMYYGSTADGLQQMKFAGIEDLWGNVAEWVEGFETGETDEFIVRYGNETQTVHTGMDMTGCDQYGYLSKIQGTTELGFSGAEFNGDETTYYADYSQFYPSGVLIFGAYWQDGADGGLFSLYAWLSADDAGPAIGARLTYL